MDGEGRALLKVLASVTFAEHKGNETQLTLQAAIAWSASEAAAALEGMEAGWSQSLHRLAEDLGKEKDMIAGSDNRTTFTTPSDREIVMTRVFDAPRELVFKVCTDPDLIPNWWGPRNLTTTVDKMDMRPGGAWRFIQRGPDGDEYAFHGVYREIAPPERVVLTFEFEGMPGHVMLQTLTFEDLGGRTKLTATSLFQTVEDRDGMLQSGMETGAVESWDRLEEILKAERPG